MSLTRRTSFIVSLCVVCVVGATSTASASPSSGTITTGSINAKVCHSVGCVTPAPGVINFKPTGTTPVTIDDTLGIDGVAWGNELGWITLDPTGPEGLVINTTTGAISGKAWSQVAGWVNFAPTGQGVSINSRGEFVGWAWAGGPYGGWIKFDCTDAAACVKTDWQPIGVRPGNGPISGGGGGGGGSPNDECWNLTGIQFSVPPGYTKVGNNVCQVTSELLASSTSGDMCLNMQGVQSTVPAGYARDTGGLCVPAPSNTTDSDGDGIPDALEQGDSDQDTVPDYLESNTTDTDGDGIPNYLDPDDDGDGYPTATERTATTDPLHTDFDEDGIPSFLDAIFNLPPTPEKPTTPTTEPRPLPRTSPATTEIIKDDTAHGAPTDTSQDAPIVVPSGPTQPDIPSATVVDNDNDGIPDTQDPVVAPNAYMRGGDSDGDGVYDADECVGGYPCPLGSNGIPAYLDPQTPTPTHAGAHTDGAAQGSGSPTGTGPHDAGVQPEAPQVVKFVFVPSTATIPVDVPALREGFRRVLSVPGVQTLVNDPAPDKPLRVDLVSLFLLLGSTSAATFGVSMTVLRALGLLAFIL